MELLRMTGLLTVLLLVSTSPRSQARLVEKIEKKGSELVIPYEKYLLPNGLTLIVHEDHSDPVVHVDVTYHVGSAREEIGKSGFAHFFEHMLFQGSDNVADEEHFRMITSVGGILNGSTNRDRTNYYQTVPTNQLERILWLESDRMGFFLDAVTQKKFEVQRATVKNEKGQRYDNVPYGKSYEIYSRNLYPYGHPYSWITIGYVEDLNRVNVNDLKNFFLRWYGPNNAVITIGGDINTAAAVKLVEKYFSSIPRGPEVKPVLAKEVKIETDRYVSYVDNYAKQPVLQVIYPVINEGHKDKAALSCLAQILGQGRNSVLYQQLVKKQVAIQATAGTSLSELAGEFSVQLMPMTGKTLTEMEGLYRSTLDSFEKRGVLEEDLARFIGGVESQLINGLQSVSGKVNQLASSQTFSGSPNRIGESLASYAAVTREDVMRVYQTYLKDKKAVFLSVLPKGMEGQMAKADNYKIDSSGYMPPAYGYEGLTYVKGKDKFDRKQKPGSGPAPVIKVPKFWRKDLANGARVIGTLSTEVPIVTLTIGIPGGHLAIGQDFSKAGLSSMFAEMMNEDTKNYTAEKLLLELQKLGSILSVSSRADEVVFSVVCLKKNLDPTLALLEERLFSPVFTEASFSRIQRRNLEFLKSQKGSPSAIATKAFAKLNYGDNHILGVPEAGTEASITSMKLQDIKDYYNGFMTAQGAKVVVVGDIAESEILSHLKFLDKLPSVKVNLLPMPPVPVVGGTKLYLVDIPNSAQTEFRVGYALNTPYTPSGDAFIYQLANYPLGGAFNSRLNLNLREDKGWTYGAGSEFRSDKYSSVFRFGSSIKGDVTDSALVEVMKEYKRYANEGITSEELEFMKTSLSLSDARSYETGLQKAGFIGRVLDYNLPADYLEKQNRILNQMTAKELQNGIRSLVQPEKLNILLTGDKKKILPGLKKLGYEIIELDSDGKPVDVKKEF